MARSVKVFVVFADTDYEGGDAVAAYFSQSSADAFVEKCRAYDALRPVEKEKTGDEAKDDAAFDKYFARWRRWDDRHPAGHSQRSYRIQTMKVSP